MWCGLCYAHTNQQPLPKGPAEGGGRGRGFWVRMLIAGASETGPDRYTSLVPPFCHHPLALADND